jgi:UDP-glucose 4-epimerase
LLATRRGECGQCKGEGERERAEELTGFSENALQAEFYKVDLRKQEEIDAVFAKYDNDGGIWGVVHLAALKAVGESGELPLEYYRVNIGGTVSLLDVSRTWN